MIIYATIFLKTFIKLNTCNHSLLSYFMSLTTTFSLLIFNEYPFKQENKLKKEQNNKRHMSSKFLLDKIISLEDLNLIN